MRTLNIQILFLLSLFVIYFATVLLLPMATLTEKQSHQMFQTIIKATEVNNEQ
jgi:ABC-type sulfate transport system permease component